MPPSRLKTRVKPASTSRSAACRLRIPWWHCMTMRVSLSSASGFFVLRIEDCLARAFGHRERGRRDRTLVGLRRDTDHLRELALRVHVAHDVRAADELSVDVELRERGPLRVLFHAVAKLLRLQDV